MATVTRGAVLDAAAGLLERHGSGGLSMRRLADELEVSYQVVYSRVGGKAEVVRALHDTWFDENAVVAEQAMDAHPPGSDERVEALALAYFRSAVAHPVRFEVMFGAPIPEFVRDDDVAAVEWACFQRLWLRAAGEWCARVLPTRPRGTAGRLAWHLWTATHGITAVHLAGHGSPTGSPEDEIQLVVVTMLDARRPS